MDFSNLKWDGEPCKAVSIVYDETTTKPMSGVPSYPVGTRVLGIRAICGKSPRPREFMRLQKNPDIPFLFDEQTPTAADVLAFAMAADPFEIGTFNSAATGAPLAAYHAYRYDLETRQLQDLGAFGGPAGTSSAFGANGDGSVVVGGSNLTTAGAS